MALTKVQIISNAISLLGKGITQSLVNQPPIVATAEQAFDMLFPSDISTAFWRFATRIIELQQLNFTPVGGYWMYAYQIPADYLEMVHLYPQTYDWEIYQNSWLFSNFNNQYQPLFMEHQFLPLIANLPPYFCEYFAYRIAAYLAISTAQSVEYASYLDNKANYFKSVAQAKDAQNRPQTPMQNAPAITKRFVSTIASG